MMLDTYILRPYLNWRLKLIIEVHFFAEKLICSKTRRVCVQPGRYWFVPITGLNWLKAYLVYAVGDQSDSVCQVQKVIILRFFLFYFATSLLYWLETVCFPKGFHRGWRGLIANRLNLLESWITYTVKSCSLFLCFWPQDTPVHFHLKCSNKVSEYLVTIICKLGSGHVRVGTSVRQDFRSKYRSPILSPRKRWKIVTDALFLGLCH